MNRTSAAYASPARGSYRVETSISPRRRQVVISSGSSSSPSASAARRVFAISDSGIPNSRMIPRWYVVAPRIAAAKASVSLAVSHIG